MLRLKSTTCCFLFLLVTLLESRSIEKCNICVTSNNENSCQSVPATSNIASINQLSEVLCPDSYVHLCGGYHHLSSDLVLDSDVEFLEIRGSSNGGSIVQCNQYGLKFEGKNKKGLKNVTIFNVTFHSCSMRDNYSQYQIYASLLFQNVSYSLHGVTIRNSSGRGIYTIKCHHQILSKCHFTNNAGGHIKILLINLSANDSKEYLVRISFSNFSAGAADQGGGLHMYVASGINIRMAISNCVFNNNKATQGSHILLDSNEKKPGRNWVVHIQNCIFKGDIRQEYTHGLVAWSKDSKSLLNVTVTNSSFADNENGAIEINCTNILIQNCQIERNKGTGINITGSANEGTEISHNTFMENFRALHLNYSETVQMAKIQHCRFLDVNFSNSDTLHKTSVYINVHDSKMLLLENCTFEKNQEESDNCSSLLIENTEHVLINNTSFRDNHCTGMTLKMSCAEIKNRVSMVGNNGLVGGALQLLGNSTLKLDSNSSLNITKNTAILYGGGIYIDQLCSSGDEVNCFFQLAKPNLVEKLMHFEDNSAGIGGDMIFGGCLSNCSLDGRTVNVKDSKNLFWNITMSQNNTSQSVFSEYANQVKFCSNESSYTNNISCSVSHKVTAYRGELFQVPLMAVDNSCFPSLGVIRAEIESQDGGKSKLIGQDYRLANKYCENYNYSIESEEKVLNVSMKLFLQKDRHSYSASPVLLTVTLKECPLGFKSGKRICECFDENLLRGIVCELTDHVLALMVPPYTWIGEYRGKVAVQAKYCHHCKGNRSGTIIHDAKTESHCLCNQRRTGVLCGSCADGYSLQLGGSKCGDCSPSTSYRVLIFVILFGVCGVILIAMLLQLNLTVSTGLINGLIFYANIIHANCEIYLPSAENASGTEKILRLLSAFQAWLNLDFGISTCFFNGLNTYHMTWLQFIFPLYIWLLILLIVFVSRYSSRVSKHTKSNIVSVLATLLLLSYTKLLITVIGAVSYTRLHFPEGGSSHPVWLLDANIRYLSDKHIPLFLMSVLMILGYIVPFTLLVSFGFLLQAKSDHKAFRWINRITPFLDAFYAPYTKSYRSWPGILLFVRLLIFLVSAFYSDGDDTFRLAIIAANLLFLLTICIVISKIFKAPLIHSRKNLDHLELFFLVNLMLFTIATSYLHATQPGEIAKQQILGIVLLGSVLVVACGIVLYQLAIIAQNWNTVKKIIHFLPIKLPGKHKIVEDAQDANEIGMSRGTSPVTTHSSVELQEMPDDQLREPLLTT